MPRTKPPTHDLSDRFAKVGILYRREAHKCARGKSYLAATILQVAALESMLHAMCLIYRHEVRQTDVYKNRKFRRKRNKTLDFSLKQLIDIAAELGWFPPKRIMWAGKRADLAGFAHEAREIRNYVHPGQWAKNHGLALKFRKSAYDSVYEVCDVAVSWLFYRNKQSLLKAMERQEKRKQRPKAAAGRRKC
jgi:hypothetical protein